MNLNQDSDHTGRLAIEAMAYLPSLAMHKVDPARLYPASVSIGNYLLVFVLQSRRDVSHCSRLTALEDRLDEQHKHT